MKRLKVNGYLVMLIILAVSYTLVEWYRPEPVSWARTYIDSDKMPYGCYALFELLEESFPGVKIESVREPAYNLLDDSARRGNYLFIGPHFKVGNSDRDALLKFVRQGNQAFIASEIFEDNFLHELNLRTETWPLSPDSLVRFLNPRLDGPRYVNPPLSPFTWFSTDTLLQAGHRPDRLGAKTTVLSEDLSGKPNFVRVKYGEGHFYLHSRPAMFSNYFLLRNQGHQYAFTALSYLPVQDIWWDEYYKQGRAGNQSLLGMIGKYDTLRWAWYFLLAGVVFYIIFEGKRRQRIIPVMEPLKNTSLEFAGVVSSLYYNQRDFKDIARKRAALFMEFLRNRYQEATDDPLRDHGFISRLSAKSGIETDRLEELFRGIAYVKVAEWISEEELHQFNGRIEDFYKKRV